MTIARAIAVIRRNENANVVINSRSKSIENYKTTVHDLKYITLNPNYEVEINLHDRDIFISANKITVHADRTYIVFYMENQQILFNLK